MYMGLVISVLGIVLVLVGAACYTRRRGHGICTVCGVVLLWIVLFFLILVEVQLVGVQVEGVQVVGVQVVGVEVVGA